MRTDRFYTTTGAIFLVLMAIGFRHYIFGGTYSDGGPVDSSILTLRGFKASGWCRPNRSMCSDECIRDNDWRRNRRHDRWARA
jgi:hypothetical protein